MKVVPNGKQHHSAIVSFSRSEAFGVVAMVVVAAAALHLALALAGPGRWSQSLFWIALACDVFGLIGVAKLVRARALFGFDRGELGAQAVRLISVGAATLMGAMLLLSPAPSTTAIPVGGSGGPLAAAEPEDEAATPESDAAAAHVVDISDDAFGPRNLTVQPGDTVRWVNRGAAPHTASADTGSFESGNLDPGDDFSFTFEQEGIYFYYCKYHGAPGRVGMWGVVRVTQGHHAAPVHAGKAPAATSTGTSAPATHHVVATDSSFGPAELRVSAGDTVMWMNEGALTHNVTAENGTFSSGNMSPGSTFSHTFTEPGVYVYYCSYHGAPHSGMWGTVIVGAAEAPDHGGGHEQDDGAEQRGKTTVGMTFSAFTPARLEVPVGTEVKWVNNSPVAHTVSWEKSGTDATLQPGDRTVRRFSRAGRYYYFCSFHGSPRSGMWGVIVVVGKDGDKPPPVDPPDDEEPPPPVEGDANVSITDDRFTPQEVEIAAGETVVWTNKGDRAHTVTSEDGTFDSGFMGAGKVFERTFNEPGTYYYFCAYHGGPRSGMWGVVTVTATPEEVSMTSSAFVPEEVHIPAGTTVKWVNDSQVAHTVTSTTGLFDSGNLAKGSSFSYTFEDPGEYLYFCNYHGAPNGTGMSGVVIVDPPANETGLLFGLPASLLALAGAQLRLRRRRKSSDPEEAPVD